MWGSFTDFAKKAQQLTDQASEAANSLSTAPTLFNLDAMQASTGGQQRPEVDHPPRFDPTAATVVAEHQSKSSTYSLPLQSVFTASTPKSNKSSSPIHAGGTNSGKLVVPGSSLASKTTTAAPTTKTTAALHTAASPAASTPTSQPPESDAVGATQEPQQGQQNESAASDSTAAAVPTSHPIPAVEMQAHPQKDGWDETEDDDDEEGAALKADGNDSSKRDTEAPTGNEDKESSTTEQTTPVLASNIDDKEVQQEKEVGWENLQRYRNQTLAQQQVQDAQVPTGGSSLLQSLDEDYFEVNAADANEEEDEDEDDEEDEDEEEDEDDDDDEGGIEAEHTQNPTAVPSSATNTSLSPHFSHGEGPPWTGKKLLVLISTKSLNRQISTMQAKVFTILDGHKVPYEKLDGAEAANKDLRDILFDVSGLRGQYPSFFFVNLADGSASYWGDWERFKLANDNGLLREELFGEEPEASLTSPPPAPDISSVDEKTSITRAIDAQATTTSHVSPESASASTTSTAVTQGGAAAAAAAAAANAGADRIPDHLLEHFTSQMKRLEENFLAERAEMEKRHAAEMKVALDSVTRESEATRRDIENSLQAKIDERDIAIKESKKLNDELKQRVESLQREMDDARKQLQLRATDLGKATAVHNRDLTVLNQRWQEAKEAEAKAKEEAAQVKKELETTKEELTTLQHEHSELKNRVKGVAQELKERRTECRELMKKLNEKTESEEQLKATLESIEGQLSVNNKSSTEKDEELEKLREENAASAQRIEKLEKEAKENQEKADKALADYKKKAQSSLAMANARAAAAVQAREEAELEARAARHTADSSIQRAVTAEMTSKEEIANAKMQVEKMQKELATSAQQLAQAEDKKQRMEEMLRRVEGELQNAKSQIQKLSSDLQHSMDQCRKEEQKSQSTYADLAEAEDQVRSLKAEVASLREDLARAESENAAASAATAGPDKKEQNVSKNPLTGSLDEASVEQLKNQLLEKAQELREANDAIEDLKDALKNAVNSQSGNATALSASANTNESAASASSTASKDNGMDGPSGADSVPLIFAMEKQAELKTARAEINRLANSLSDSVSDKMDAIERMEEMKRRMEDAEARLKRFEKLSTSQQVTTAGSDENGEAQTTDSGAVNIEYLKHIMLRYLNAKSVNDKKALVPVIGAVLCLTQDELQAALKNIESTSSLGGVKLFESISGNFLSR